MSDKKNIPPKNVPNGEGQKPTPHIGNNPKIAPPNKPAPPPPRPKKK